MCILVGVPAGDHVAAGFDMLQAFQPKAGNDFAQAFAAYGDRLTFVTGINVQQGESMSADELRADILRSYQIGRRTGRHILGMTHILQYTMLPANVRAIFETVAEIQAGNTGERHGRTRTQPERLEQAG